MALLDVNNLVKEFSRKRGILSPSTVVRAVDDVSFSIEEGETFGLVGESGSGKTTTGRCILRLIEPTSGQGRFKQEDVRSFARARPGAICRSCFRILSPL
jgi:oligopeptide transport system ATP-binding protein